MDNINWTKDASLKSANISERGKSVLTSTDSLTSLLEDLLSCRLSAEIVSSTEATAPDSFSMPKNSHSLRRIIWLKNSNEKLVYADSIIASTDKSVLDTISTSTEPIGRLLNSMGVGFSKSSISISLVNAGQSAQTDETLKDLFSASQYLFKKTYTLDNSLDSSYTIKALITEVFHPSLMLLK